MKKLFILIPILILLTSCSLIQKRNRHYLGTLENTKIFRLNKSDSIKAYKSKLLEEKSLEECEKRFNSNCIDDIGIMTNDGGFARGTDNFRKILFEKFKPSKNSKTGENLIQVTIGTNDNLDNIKVLKYTDEDTKKAIEDIFRLKELNTWKSAKVYGYPVKQQFEISIFIENRKKISNNN